MAPFFFRVEHDLLRSESFKTLGGSAIKVYLTIGLYSDFGTDWAYPSVRTIASRAGLSRQTVLVAIAELTRCGLLAASKSKGKSTAYKILRQPPDRPPGAAGKKKAGRDSEPTLSRNLRSTGPLFREGPPESGPDSLVPEVGTGLNSFEGLAQLFGPGGPEVGPKREPAPKEDTNTIPIPGTPFRLTAEGRLLVAVDLQELLKDQGIPQRLAERLASRKDPEAVAKVLLNAIYLQSQGKLQNGPGYIRAGIEEGYDLLPQVATRLEGRRRELETRLRAIAEERSRKREAKALEEEEAAIHLVIASLGPEELQGLIRKALEGLPEPIVRRNPTLSNPFVRAKVYELACGEPLV